MDSAPKKKILVVDDDPTMIEELVGKINAAGMNGVGVYSGKEALEYITTHKVDYMILDFIMPEMDGYTFYHIMTHDMRLKIPAVVLTVMPKPPNAPEGLEHFSKIETNKDELIAKIKTFLLSGA